LGRKTSQSISSGTKVHRERRRRSSQTIKTDSPNGIRARKRFQYKKTKTPSPEYARRAARMTQQSELAAPVP
jgi:hypothetical protein